MSSIQRQTFHRNTSIANGAAISGEVECAGASSGMVYVPSAWTAADISFVVAPYPAAASTGTATNKPAPTFNKVRSSAGALVRITNVVTNEAGWYDIPDAVLKAGVFKIKSTNTASEADVNQGAARSLKVLFKA